MYLFLCETFDGHIDCNFVEATSSFEAILKLFEKMNCATISKELFEKMLLGNELWERVAIFNTVFSSYRIKAMYGGLYQIDIEEAKNEAL